MKKAIIIGIILFALLVPSVQGVCINATYEGEIGFLGDTQLTINRFCQYGCDSAKGKCSDPFNPTTQQSNMSLILFIIVLVMAFGALVIGFLKKRLSAMFIAFVLFVVLALQSFSFDIVLSGTQFSGLSTVFIGICWLFALISFVSILVGMVSFAKNRVKQNPAM